MPGEIQLLPTSQQVDVLIKVLRVFIYEKNVLPIEQEIAEELLLEILKKRRQQREK